MKKEEILAFDWHRIFIGQAPFEFMIEVLVRAIIIYLLLLITLRFTGKRMGGQLSITELAVMLTLGAIVAVGMQAPDKGIMQGALALFCAFVFQRGYTYFTVKSQKFERFTQGAESVLVENGVICTNKLIAMKISREQVLAALRNNEVYNLGEIQRLYIESCGLFSIFSYPTAKPGLPLLPPGDEVALNVFNKVEDCKVCSECGLPAKTTAEANQQCQNCNNNNWIYAVLTQKP